MNDSFRLQEVTDKQVWESFVLQQAHPQFMQSWNAGEHAQQQNRPFVRFGLSQGETLVSTCFGEIVRARRGSHLLIPYGPVMSAPSKEIIATWSNLLAEWGRAQQLDFIRFCPFLERTQENELILASTRLKRAPIHTLAEYIWLLPLNQEESQLMAGMSKTTRNLIRRAEKEGVRITMSTDQADVDKFLTLHRATKDRHQFTPYPDSLFRTQVTAYAKDNQVAVFCAYHQDTLIASSIVMYYGSMASYHHGASIPSKIPAAYALQWAAIREAKKRGCTVYNFWGVTDLSDTKHPFYGISLFKTRFGGGPMSLVMSQDLPLSPRYRLTAIIETIRRIRRGFGWRRH